MGRIHLGFLNASRVITILKKYVKYPSENHRLRNLGADTFIIKSFASLNMNKVSKRK